MPPHQLDVEGDVAQGHAFLSLVNFTFIIFTFINFDFRHIRL